MRRIDKLSRLIRFFLKNVPYQIIFSICTLLFAQLFLVLSYFLPIKVILLLATDSMPSFLSSLFFNIEKNEIILILTFLVFVFYGFHIIFERFSTSLMQHIVNHFFNIKGETVYLKNEFIYKYIDGFLKFLSTFVFLIFIYVTVLYLFTSVGIVILIYTILVYLVYINMKIDSENYGKFFQFSSGTGFMVVFVFEVIDILYIHSQETSLLIILLSLVLARYIFMRSAYMMNKLIFMYSNINKFYERIEAINK